MVGFAIDLDGGVYEVGTGTAVPFTGGNDDDFLVVVGEVFAGEVAGEPAGLDLDFIKGRRGGARGENGSW